MKSYAEILACYKRDNRKDGNFTFTKERLFEYEDVACSFAGKKSPSNNAASVEKIARVPDDALQIPGRVPARRVSDFRRAVKFAPLL